VPVRHSSVYEHLPPRTRLSAIPGSRHFYHPYLFFLLRRTFGILFKETSFPARPTMRTPLPPLASSRPRFDSSVRLKPRKVICSRMILCFRSSGCSARVCAPFPKLSSVLCSAARGSSETSFFFPPSNDLLPWPPRPSLPPSY